MEKPWFLQLKQTPKDFPLSADQKNRLLELKSLLQIHFEDEEDFISWAQEHLPRVMCTETTPGSIRLTIVTYTRISQRIETFLLDLVRTCFLSDSLQLSSLQYTPFTLERHVGQNFLIADFHFSTERKSDFENIERTIPLIQNELALYFSFSQYTETLLRLEPSASNDELYFREAILQLLQRWPDDFGKDFLQDYHHFLGLSQKEFRNHRSIRHQIRLLSSLYLMRKKVMRKLPLSLNELHLKVRLIPTRLQFPFGQKSVIGVAIVINLPTPYERFDSQHIIMAVQKLIPWTQAIQESFLSFQKPGSSLRSMYLEIEKTNDSPFTLMEMTLLKQQLRNELTKSVEVLSPSIFGLCDVEEVMRNTFLLSQELQALTDLPQAMISFEGSSNKSLIFRVIVVRLLVEQSRPLPSYFQMLEEPFEYIPERSSTVGYIGRYEKEASVFRLQLSKTPFLFRSDSSLNLYRARQYIYSLLTKALGEIRDYNGGIFAKQLELFLQFRQSFQQEDSELLEDFFHSIQPPELQAILPLPSLKTFFHLFLEARKSKLPGRDRYFFETREEEPFFFAFVRINDSSFQERMTQALIQANLLQEVTAWTITKHHNDLMLGYVCSSFTGKRETFAQILRHNLEQWSTEKRNYQILRLDLDALPISLDPRLGGDYISRTLLKMLFEGLMRIGKDGKLEFGSAENVIISEEGKRYIFTLRKCFWNNGDRVTAYDFCYAWKKILSPNFETAFAYLFYIIKNAKRAKKGEVSVEDVGIEALDDQTLIIDLEYPCSYFLELTSNHLYSPVNHKVDQTYPNWPLQTRKAYVCNGPFYLENAQDGYILNKNSSYWDTSNIRLNSVQFFKASAKKALQMFKNGEIDWLGRPSRPWEPYFSASIEQPIEELLPSAVCWCTCNLRYPPLHSSKLRLALAYALDRSAIAQRLSVNLIPAYSPMPLIHSHHREICKDDSKEMAQRLFEEALQELKIERSQFPQMTLLHTDNEIRKETAYIMVQQWQEVLGITVHPKMGTFHDIFDKTTRGNYQLSLIMWRTWADDPLYTLNTFKYPHEEFNFAGWENYQYQQLIDQAILEGDVRNRQQILATAEDLLIQEMPVIPIFHEIELLSRAEYVEGVTVSPLGDIDFKYAYLQKDSGPQSLWPVKKEAKEKHLSK